MKNSLFSFLMVASFYTGGLLYAETNVETRISYGEVIYHRDFSKPPLGVAFRDPGGLIWGQNHRQDGRYNGAPIGEISKICESMGARLPSLTELENLRKNLTDVRTGFYNPYATNLQGYIFPDLGDGFSLAITTPKIIFDDTKCQIYEFYYISTNNGRILKTTLESYGCSCGDGDTDSKHDRCYDTQQFRCVTK